MKNLLSTGMAYLIVFAALLYCFRAATHQDTPAEASERAHQYELTKHAGCAAYVADSKRPTAAEIRAYNKCMAE